MSKSITDFYVSFLQTDIYDTSWLYRVDIYGLKIQHDDEFLPKDIKIHRISFEKRITGHVWAFSSTMDIYIKFVLYFAGYTVVDIHDNNKIIHLPK